MTDVPAAPTAAPQPAPQPATLQTPQPVSQMREFEYAGGVIQFPSDWTPEQINQGLARFRETPEFYQLMDRETGAPARIRAQVGSAYTMQDKLTTLQQSYPDAVQFGEDNFVFTSPDTGKPTLYNPKGLDWGDVAGVTREITVGTGATLGAVGGGLLGAGASVPTGGTAAPYTVPQGAVIGAGFGAAATGQFYDLLANQFMGVHDTRSLPQKTLDMVIEGAGSAAGQRVGEVVGPAISTGVKRILGGGTQRSQQLYQTLQALNIKPTAGVVTEGGWAGRIEAALDAAPTSAKVMQDQVKQVLDDAQAAATRTAAQIGKPSTQQRAGEVLQTGVDKATERFVQAQTKMEDQLTTLLGDDALIPVTNVRALREGLEEQIQQLPQTLGPRFKGVIDELKRLEADADTLGGIPYRLFRSHRTLVGQRMGDLQERVEKKTLLKRLYGAMTQDLEDFVRAQGGEAAKQFDETMALTRNWNTTNRELFDKISKFDAAEKAYRYVINSRKDGGTVLQKLRSEFSDQEWNDVSATVIQKMGFKNFGNEGDDFFSPSTFITNYRSIANEAKDALFGPANTELRQGLDQLMEAMTAIQSNARLGNFSNTASVMHLLDTLAVLGVDTTSLATQLVTGGSPRAAATSFVGNTVGRLLLPRQVAKLMTNADFVKWLATPVTRKNGVGPHIGRLAAIAKANPEIQDEVRSFLDTLGQDQPAEGEQP